MAARFGFHARRRLAGWRHQLRRHITPAGRLLLAGLVGAALLGVDTRQNPAHQLFTLLLAIALLALAGLRMRRPSLQLQRELPRYLTEGDTLSYPVQLRNIGTQVLRGASLGENWPDPRPDAQAFLHARRVGEGADARWQRLCRQATRAQGEPASVPALAPGAKLGITLQLHALRRGHLQLPGLQVQQTEWLGLFCRQFAQPLAASLLVLPRRYRLPPPMLPGRRAREQERSALGDSLAEAEEFQSLRDYRPGDPLRLIHWKSWARSGKPVIRECQEETSVRHALVLDTFCPLHAEDALEEAVRLAASFACSVDTRESLLDLLFAGQQVYRETMGRGHGSELQLLEVLAGVQACDALPFRLLQDAVLAHRHELSGVICILIAWDDARASFIRTLAALGVAHQAWLIVPADSQPARPDWQALGVRLLEAGKLPEGLGCA